MSKRSKICILLLLGCLALNVLFSLCPVRVDLTRDGRFSLSEETLRVLGALKQPVTIDLYRSRSLSGIPPRLQSHGDYVEELLREYCRHSDGLVEFRLHDPAVGTSAEEQAMKSGMVFEELRPGDASSRFCLGVCLSQLGQSDIALRQLDPRAVNSLEYDLTRALSRLAFAHRPRVGVCSSLPVFGGIEVETQRQRPEWQVIRSLRENNYEVVDLGGDLTQLNDEVDILFLIHPPEMDVSSLQAVDDFIQGGGSLLGFLDPGCWTDMMYHRDGHVRASSLTGLLKVWGVTFDHQHTVLDKSLATIVQNQQSVPENHLEWLSLKPGQLSASDAVTSHLSLLELYHAGSFRWEEVPGVSVHGLLYSSDSAHLISSQLAFRSQKMLEEDYAPGRESLCLGVSLEGALPSALSSGVSSGSKVILLGDADCLHDQFIMRRQTDNLQLVLNCLDRLRREGEGLLALRNRSYGSNRLEVLHQRLERDQRAFQAELDRFQTERLALREEISGLESRRHAGLLSDHEAGELREKYSRIVSADRTLRQMQASASRSREGYRQRIIMLNLLLGPILVVLVLLSCPYYRLWRRSWRRGLCLTVSLLVVTGGLWGLCHWGRSHDSAGVSADRVCLLTEQLRRDNLLGLVFRHGDEVFHLDRSADGTWTVRERGGYPANIFMLNDLTSSLNVCDGVPVAASAEQLSSLELGEGQGWSVSFTGKESWEQTVLFGDFKRNYAHEPQGRYVRVDDGGVILSGQHFRCIGVPLVGWLDSRLPGFGNEAKRISRVSEFRDLRWSLERRPGGYEVCGRLPRGMSVSAPVVKNMIDNFRYLRVLDVESEVKEFKRLFSLSVIGSDDIVYDYVFGVSGSGGWYCRLTGAAGVGKSEECARLLSLYGRHYLAVNGKLASAFLRSRGDLYRGKYR